MLFEKIENDIKAAQKERNETVLSTLRMLKSGIKNAQLTKDKGDLSDTDVIAVLRRQINEHKDSIEGFKKGARGDLVAKEEAELNILLAYMPPGLSEAEIDVMVKSAIEEAGSTSKKDMGKIMKIVMEKAQGAADGKTVSQVVGRYLK